MALIKCTECGKEFSDKANACPNCACPIEREKKKVRIFKNGGFALRCNVFIDNQSVGQVGVGTTKSIELELPIGTHYISIITQVKNQATLIASNGTSTMAAPITTSTSQEQDGKQFEIKESDELTEIEILTKASFTGSTGRCIVGNIKKYSADEMINKTEELQSQKKKEAVKKDLTSTFIDIGIYVIVCALILLFIFMATHNAMINWVLAIIMLVYGIRKFFFQHK